MPLERQVVSSQGDETATVGLRSMNDAALSEGEIFFGGVKAEVVYASGKQTFVKTSEDMAWAGTGLS